MNSDQPDQIGDYTLVCFPGAHPGRRSEEHEEQIMGKADIVAGRTKQAKGKMNDVAGAISGNTGRQLKGKVQKVVGKIQAKLGGARRTRV